MYQDEIIPFLEIYYTTLGKSKVSDIIKYSVEGGKCIRGFIVKHIIETYTGSKTTLWEPITSIELIHSASLIIDDLPCMDNDDIRRGKPSTFCKFSEREAIMTSFYIVSESLRLLTNCLNNIKNELITNNIDIENSFFSSNKQLDILNNVITNWCELLGKNLVVGQLLDLKENVEDLFNLKLNLNDSKNIIFYKTCSLFMFSFIIGAVFSGQNNLNIEEFKEMGIHFGIMFQIMDDFKDIDQDKIEQSTNYILENGIDKSILSYTDAKNKLEFLLKKNNIYTDEFKTLISKISLNFNYVTKKII